MICPNCKSDDVKVQVVAEQKSVAFSAFAFGLFSVSLLAVLHFYFLYL